MDAESKEPELKWYRKKSLSIQAIEIDSSIAEHPTFKDYIEPGLLLATVDKPTENYYEIKTHSGTQLASDGDFLIIGVEDEIYPCRRSVFLKTYEEVSISTKEKWVYDEQSRRMQKVGRGNE